MVAHDLPADDELGGRRNRIAANHLPLIRSFLPESMLSGAHVRSSVQKFSIRSQACFKRRQRKTQRSKFANSFRNCAENQLPPLQKSLFHSIFCNQDHAHTNLVLRWERTSMMMTVVTSMHRRVSQRARAHVSLSGNAVFFAVL
jgi:CRISPR/Cas system endoribonuclease Cas6 (RAMP superfamily)